MKLAAAFSIWVAHARRVLVAVSRRTYLSFCCAKESAFVFRKVRDGGTPSPARETRALPRTTSTLAHN